MNNQTPNSETDQLRRAKAIVNALPDNAFVFSKDGTCIELYVGNDESIPSFDYQKLIGLNLTEIVSKSLARKLLVHIEQAITFGRTEVIMHSVEPSDLNPEFNSDVNLQRTIWYEGKITPLALNGEAFDSVLWITRNISEKVEMEQKIQYLLERDELTKLYNRRTFLAKLSSYFEKFQLNGSNSTVLTIDIDHFKRWNDRFGHLVGDKVLKHVAAQCQSHLRSTDIVGRLGGEEFAAILPKTSPEQAVELAERLRKAVEVNPFVHNQQKVAATISTGICLFNDSDTCKTDILHRSDKAMYQSKHQGRNQVTVYAAPPKRQGLKQKRSLSGSFFITMSLFGATWLSFTTLKGWVYRVDHLNRESFNRSR
ncbi:GGDEF domain-containing protein [Corallincola platygyrae]|uniref:diguanylate cyclase n=1 Tax=Corallincola platygyrae TaxID=1193278 RepID=A0ABW4XRE0_9GAMM